MKTTKYLNSTSIVNFFSSGTHKVEDFFDVVYLGVDRMTLNSELLTGIFSKVFSKQIRQWLFKLLFLWM